MTESTHAWASTAHVAVRKANIWSKWTVGSFLALSFWSIVLVVRRLQEKAFITAVMNGRATTAEEVDSFDRVTMVLGLIGLPIALGASLCFLFWLARRVTATRILTHGQFVHTPRWAVGSCFIPLWNIYKPAKVMSDIVRASDVSVPEPSRWRSGRNLDIAIFSYTILIIAQSALRRVGDRLMRNDDVAIENFFKVNSLLTWSSLTALLGYGLLAYVLWQVTVRQNKKLERAITPGFQAPVTA